MQNVIFTSPECNVWLSVTEGSLQRASHSGQSDLIINVRSLSSRTYPFMGMFDWDEDLIPLIQSPGGNAPIKPLIT